MDPFVRRAALRAAQKTAIILSLAGASVGVGCAASHERDLIAMRPMPETVDATVAVPDAAPEVDASAPSEDARVVAPADCEERLAALELTGTEDVWTTRFANESDRNDPIVGACCMEEEQLAAEGASDVVFQPIGMACCDVIVYAQHLQPYSNLGCTPWGPPCPPEAPV